MNSVIGLFNTRMTFYHISIFTIIITIIYFHISGFLKY